MDLSKVLRESIKDRGIWGTLQVAFSYIIDYFFDLRYRTDTFSWVELEDLEIESKNISRGGRYQPTHTFSLRNLLNNCRSQLIKPLLTWVVEKARFY